MGKFSSVMPAFQEKGEGKPILLIPGMEGSTGFWRFQADFFSKTHRVISCDHLRRRPSHHTRISDYAAGVLRLLDHLEIETACIMGESFGGMVAQELAIRHGKRVSALALCNTLHQPSRGGAGANKVTVATFAQPFVFALPRHKQLSFLHWVGQNRGFVMDPSAGNEELSRYVLAYGLNPGVRGYLDRIIAASRVDFSEDLGDIHCPTLVFRGTEDRLILESTTRQMAQAIPHSEYAEVQGGGHCCQHSLPDQSNKLFRDWLERIDY